MQMKKNEKGITLIALAVMVIIMVIIATITFYSGVSTIQDSKQRRLKLELETVQHAVLERYTKYKLVKDDSYLVGTKVTDINTIPYEYRDLLKSQVNATEAEANYYILEDEEMHFKKLDLIKPTFTYIVCYKTGEVMNKEVTTFSDGDFIYTCFE